MGLEELLGGVEPVNPPAPVLNPLDEAGDGARRYRVPDAAGDRPRGAPVSPTVGVTGLNVRTPSPESRRDTRETATRQPRPTGAPGESPYSMGSTGQEKLLEG